MAVPAKIVLKSTTKMSLSDRFSAIQAAVRQPAQGASVPNIRAKMAAQQQASAANKRLAMQMANRPSVQAALKIKKKTLKQRLGNQSIKSRLTLGNRGGGGGGGITRGGRGQGRLMRSRGQGRFMRGRGQNRGRGGSGGGAASTLSPSSNKQWRGGNRGQRGGGFVQRGGSGFVQRGGSGFVQRGGGGFVQRGGQQRGGGGGGDRGQRGGMQRGRGRGLLLK